MLFLSKSKQNECIVEIEAQQSIEFCLESQLSSGFISIMEESADAKRCFISAAASFVNVTTIILSTGTGFSRSEIILISLSTSTEVLPLPAAADTITERPEAFIA